MLACKDANFSHCYSMWLSVQYLLTRFNHVALLTPAPTELTKFVDLFCDSSFEHCCELAVTTGCLF